MPAITEDFDFLIKVVQPSLTKGLPGSSKAKLNTSGEFIFTPPPQVVPILSDQSSVLKSEEVSRVDGVLKQLKDVGDQQSRYMSIIDKRCKHIVVNYNPNLKKDEAITDACEKVFKDISGRITYKMYTDAVDYLNQLEVFMGHRTIQNEGFLDGA